MALGFFEGVLNPDHLKIIKGHEFIKGSVEWGEEVRGVRAEELLQRRMAVGSRAAWEAAGRC